MNKRIFVSLCCLFAATGIAGPPAAHARSAAKASFPLTITDDTGTRVKIGHQPKRLLTLDPRDTETLFALGLENRIVGDGGQYVEGAAGIDRPFTKAEWPYRWGRDYPVRSKTLPHVEGGYDAQHPFNLETIESLHPDLIFTLETDLPTLQKLRELGFKVIVLNPSTIKGIYHDFQMAGDVTGTQSRAKLLVATIKKEIVGVRRRLARIHSRPRVYYEIDATNPTEPYTAGPGTFIDDALKVAEGQNVADSVSTCSGTTCYPQLSLESLVSVDPQVILLGDAAYGTTVDQVKARSGWETMSAIKDGKIYPFDDELVSRAGPRIGLGIVALARDIHPEAFK